MREPFVYMVPRSRWHPDGRVVIDWTPFEFGWVAGLLEGEGTFYAAPMGEGRYEPRIACAMTDRDIIDRLASLLPGNGNLIGLPLRGTFKPQYRVSCNGGNAIALAAYLRPVLSERRQSQVDVMLAKSTMRTVA